MLAEDEVDEAEGAAGGLMAVVEMGEVTFWDPRLCSCSALASAFSWVRTK